MKYVTITGGLGNQMFVYAFCLKLRKLGHKAVLWVPRVHDSKGYGHQGYELRKLFDVTEYEENYSSLERSVLTFFSQAIRVFPSKYKRTLFKLIGFNTIRVAENFIYYPEVFDFKFKNEIYFGTWQSQKYFEGAEQEVREALRFNVNLLNNQSKEYGQKMQSEQSVSIHIRRGDYLSAQYADGFAGICDEEYYNNAMNYINQRIENVLYYVFTDDAEWVSDNFKIANAVYINHNRGQDSWQDMYLMSQCKHNIIANSSFSWWGAWLNENPNKIVIAPKLWWRPFEKDDVVPDEWIRI